MSRQNQEPDELRARFTVYIKQVIIHAKLDYIRKKNRTSQEISLEDLDFEPAVDFEEQYSQTNSEQKSFEFEEEHLANAFAALPLLRQKVLEMLFVQELTPLEIFPLNRFVLLYAVTYYLRHTSIIKYSDFARRIRIVNNLIQNSGDEVSDRTDRNRMPAILAQTEAIIATGKIDDSIEKSFNVNQLSEEKKKIEFLDDNPGQAKTMFELEDHPMLKGQIGIIGIENLSLANMFAKLFTCNWDKIDRALMATGNYRQEEKNGWRYQCASKSKQFAWDELFHRSANYCGFDNTKKILIKLLQGNATFTNEILDGIADGFIASCTSNSTYPWRYYYVKYDAFRPGSYGKLRNSEASKKPYLFSVMQTKTQWSQNTYMPYLKIVDDYHLSHYDMGQKLLYDDRYIVCENASYKVKRIEDNSIIDTVEISQDKNGIDKEDRVQKLKNYLSSKTIPKTIP